MTRRRTGEVAYNLGLGLIARLPLLKATGRKCRWMEASAGSCRDEQNGDRKQRQSAGRRRSTAKWRSKQRGVTPTRHSSRAQLQRQRRLHGRDSCCKAAYIHGNRSQAFNKTRGWSRRQRRLGQQRGIARTTTTACFARLCPVGYLHTHSPVSIWIVLNKLLRCTDEIPNRLNTISNLFFKIKGDVYGFSSNFCHRSIAAQRWTD